LGELSTFETIAQIAIGIVGFSGIVLAVRAPVIHELSAIGQARLTDLFMAGFGALFFSFAPLWFYSLTGSSELSWRLAHFCLSAHYAVSLFVLLWRIRHVLMEVLTNLLFVPVGATFAAVMMLVAFGYLSSFAFSIYFLALLFLLFCAALEFVLLVWSRSDA
jgi:hypothetical protein